MNMLLKSATLNRYNNLYFEPIQVTSPDQFVPLYLATELDDVFSSRYYDYTYNIYAPSDHRWKSREATKEMLMEQLNKPYPKQYRFSISNYDDGNNPLDYSWAQIAPAFLGLQDSLVASRGAIRLGLAMDRIVYGEYRISKTSGNPYVSEQKRIPNPSCYNAMSAPDSNFRVCTLIVVKAKHIPYLKARLYLKLPISLPLGDLKYLKNTSNPTLSAGLLQNRELGQFIQQMQPIQEFVTGDALREFLIPNYNSYQIQKPRAEYIKDALQVLQEVE